MNAAAESPDALEGLRDDQVVTGQHDSDRRASDDQIMRAGAVIELGHEQEGNGAVLRLEEVAGCGSPQAGGSLPAGFWHLASASSRTVTPSTDLPRPTTLPLTVTESAVTSNFGLFLEK